jgi:hypothetical protein
MILRRRVRSTGTPVYTTRLIMAKPIVIGDKFGRWTVVGESSRRTHGREWLCICECGAEKSVQQVRLNWGRSKSCGCWANELVSKANRTHGDAHSPEHEAWSQMIARCTNPNSRSYKNYGGRGIEVCSEWMASYESFLRDMGRRPHPKMSIDRIDNDNGYFPGNVRWATWKQQERNKRNNHLLVCNGKTATIAEWSEITGIPFPTIKGRLRRGWTEEKALTIPPQHIGYEVAMNHWAEKRKLHSTRDGD